MDTTGLWYVAVSITTIYQDHCVHSGQTLVSWYIIQEVPLIFWLGIVCCTTNSLMKRRWKAKSTELQNNKAMVMKLRFLRPTHIVSLTLTVNF